MIVTLPLPHKYLNPNYRVNRQGKARVVKKYREDAYIAAIHAGAKDMRLETVKVQCKFFFREERRRDGDNLLSSLKAAFDGLVDAGVFIDDQGLSHLPAEYSKDAKNPRVEIHILTEEDPINGSYPWDPPSRRAQEA